LSPNSLEDILWVRLQPLPKHRAEESSRRCNRPRFLALTREGVGAENLRLAQAFAGMSSGDAGVSDGASLPGLRNRLSNATAAWLSFSSRR
jgi:hypothetical protein